MRCTLLYPQGPISVLVPSLACSPVSLPPVAGLAFASMYAYVCQAHLGQVICTIQAEQTGVDIDKVACLQASDLPPTQRGSQVQRSMRVRSRAWAAKGV